MNNEPVKIDIIGSLSTAISQMVATIGIICVLTCFLGCLIAPWFASMFEPGICEKLEVGKYPSRIPLIKNAMAGVKSALWVVAILSWCILFAVIL